MSECQVCGSETSRFLIVRVTDSKRLVMNRSSMDIRLCFTCVDLIAYVHSSDGYQELKTRIPG